MRDFMETCTMVVSITDCGFDHSVRSRDVHYTEAVLFLERDLDFFVHGVRASGLSSYSEAERLNSAETVTLTRAELPSMLKQRVPTSAPELLHNAVEFLTAVSNAIGTGTYAERNPMIVCDGCSSCQHISCVGLEYMHAAHRLDLRQTSGKRFFAYTQMARYTQMIFDIRK